VCCSSGHSKPLVQWTKNLNWQDWLVTRKWDFREPRLKGFFKKKKIKPLVVDNEKVVCPLHVYSPSK
jgi:uncharacterized protein YutD